MLWQRWLGLGDRKGIWWPVQTCDNYSKVPFRNQCKKKTNRQPANSGSRNMEILQFKGLSAVVTRRPASTDRTARREFQATGQPVSRTQASDAMTSQLPCYEAKCVQRRCFQWGSVPLRSDMKGWSYPLPMYWYHSKGNWTLVDGSLESPCRVLVKCNWTSFSTSYGSGATRQNVSKLATFRRGWVSLSQDFMRKGSSPCQYIDTTPKAIDCATTLPLTVFI